MSSEVAVVDLRADFVASPLGLMTLQPQLSWRITTVRRGMRQSAYRIEVASSVESLASGLADLWDSGRVASDSSTGVRYGGATLTSRRRCFWKVSVWDETGVHAAESEISSWEMGLLHPGDWSAQWLAVEDPIMRDDRAAGLSWIRGPVASDWQGGPGFRLRFDIPAAAEGVLYVASYGEVTIWLDGAVVEVPKGAPLVLGPRLTGEIPVVLAPGTHILAIALGSPDPRLAAFGFPAGELAPFLRVRCSDGSIQRFNGSHWKAASSNNEGWQSTDFEDGAWARAAVVRESRRQPWPKHKAFYLRRVFQVHKPVARARLYVTALGSYEPHLNGRRVGEGLLAPESTDFRKRALYRVYDVTEQIVRGENVVAAIVADGWYASYTVIAGRYAWGSAPRCLLTQLEITYADEVCEVIGSGTGWRIDAAPVVSAEIYDGEYYDARLEQTGWSMPGFDDSGWQQAQLATAPSVALTAHVSAPIRRTQEMQACAVTQPRPGVFVFDFGQNFAGWCRLRITGAAGSVIEMRFAELLTLEGEIDQSNLRSSRQTDTYVLKGDPAGEVFEPHFTYHGFRYVQLSGFPGVPTAENLLGIVVHSDLDMTGTLTADNTTLQRICQNTWWSQRSNFMGIPTDCPQRDERLGWMGDANIFWDAAAFNMDIAAFSRRFMGDVRDAQAEDGAFAEFSPAAYRDPPAGGAQDYSVAARAFIACGPAPGWADGGVCIPWTVWQRYGDTGIIEENWAAMTRYLRLLVDSNPDYVWRKGRGADYGDWLALDAKTPADPTTPKDLVATAIWSHSVHCMGDMAEAISHHEEARHYRALWSRISSAFQKSFITVDGTVGNGSQTGYILALRYNLVPDHLKREAARKLVADIQERGTVLSTGFLGTPGSLDVLADAGYSDLVYSLLLRTEFPSWGYMVSRGATTIWERWNSDVNDVAMNSFNHYALGAVTGFIFRRIGGIAPLQPAFRKIEVRPLLDPRVKSAGAEYRSVLGRIATRWGQHSGNRFFLEVTIPPNSSAVVHLPLAHGAVEILESGKSIAGHPDIRELFREQGRAVMEVGSGSYEFSVEAADAGRR